jgi:hypothetical protein
MSATRAFAILLLGTTAAFAQGDAPAELPPAGFEGRQYVDSRGCVFLRAEVDGAVTWVAQLTASREPICNRRPTMDTAASPPPEPQMPADVATPGGLGAEATAPPPLADTPAAPPAATATARDERAAPRDAKSPDLAAAEAPRPVAAARVRVTPRRAAPVHRAPAAAPPRSYADPSVTAAARAIAGNSPFYPLPYDAPVAVPPGYRPAFDDGRLNPHRGKQTLGGALSMALVWTQEVPRRLVDRNSGRDMTETLHYLVYPYTDYDKQLADLRAGTHVAVRTAQGQRLIVRRDQLRQRDGAVTVAAAPRVSTRSEPAPAATPRQPPAAPATRYVNVGLFASESDARQVAQRLAALGLPVRLARYRNGAAGQRLVMAGPYPEGAALTRALGTVRGAGYPGATLR